MTKNKICPQEIIEIDIKEESPETELVPERKKCCDFFIANGVFFVTCLITSLVVTVFANEARQCLENKLTEDIIPLEECQNFVYSFYGGEENCSYLLSCRSDLKDCDTVCGNPDLFIPGFVSLVLSTIGMIISFRAI